MEIIVGQLSGFCFGVNNAVTKALELIEKKENGVLYGHEMLDEFIKFYNDERSVFATDMNSGYQQITGVTNTTEENVLSGYIVAPQSGDRLLPDKENPTTRIAAKISGVAATATNVKFCS